MLASKPTLYESAKVTRLILYGSLWVSLILTALLLAYDLEQQSGLRTRTIIGFVIIIYLGFCWLFVRKLHMRTVNWLLILLYGSLSIATLLTWGLNASSGIFATSFVIILSGILLGSRTILPVSVVVSVLILAVQLVHTLDIITPNLTPLYQKSTFVDVIAYLTILGIFALIIWVSGSQMEKSLKRAHQAESALRSQKALLAKELETESALLRSAQLEEMQQLYKFATLGQSTAATLHELSNHLSVLNLDIDDLQQQHRNSTAIENAKEGIEHINLMVRQVRRKLDSFDDSKVFKIGTVIKKVLKDQSLKPQMVEISYEPNGLGNTSLKGDPLALSQIITSLITNATEACSGLPNAKIRLALNVDTQKLFISVIDNGIGIRKSEIKSLFSPTQSRKPSGLGVGLYIARHLAVSQFKGSITFEAPSKPTQPGAHFLVHLPLITSEVSHDRK